MPLALIYFAMEASCSTKQSHGTKKALELKERSEFEMNHSFLLLPSFALANMQFQTIGKYA